MNFLTELLATSGSGSFELIALCLYVGVLIACGMAIYEKRVLGEFIRTLLKMDATAPERALTLSQAGYGKKSAIKRALRGNGVFKGLVYEASEEVTFDRENHALPIFREKFDEGTARFYIPEPLKYRAQVRFEKKGSHIMALVLGAILFGVLILVTLLFKDQVLKLVDQYLDMMRGYSDTYTYSIL